MNAQRSNIQHVVIDFSDKASLSRRMPILTDLNAKLIEKTHPVVSRLFNIPCEIILESFESKRLCEEKDSHLYFSTLYKVAFASMNKDCLISIDKTFVYYAVEYAFGGGKKQSAPFFEMTLESKIGFSIIDRFLSQITKAMQSSLNELVCEEMANNSVTYSRYRWKDNDKSKVFIVSSFLLKSKHENFGKLSILWPYECLVSIQDKKENRASIASDEKQEDVFKERLHQIIKKINLPAVAKICHKNIKLSQVMDWRPGDIVPMSSLDDILLCIKDIPVFKGVLGNSDDKYALKILENIG
jgi:flagellar motor switch protein FliM